MMTSKDYNIDFALKVVYIWFYAQEKLQIYQVK